MNCILIETSAYTDLQAHVRRLLERVSALQALTEKSPTARWLTTDDVCKALSITKRQIPYTSIGGKILYPQSALYKLLESHYVSPLR